MNSLAHPTDGFRRGSSPYRRLLIALFAAGIATFAPLYAPQSVLPLIARNANVTPDVAALTVSVATGALAVGILPWAVLASRIGRARAISIAMLGAATTNCLVPFAEAFPLFLAGRAVMGLLLAAVPAVAVAYLAELVRAGDVARAAGVYVAGTTVGGLLGRVITGPVSEWTGWRTAMFAVALGSLAAALVFVLLAPRGRSVKTSSVDRGVRSERGIAAPRSPVTLRGFAARAVQSLRIPPLPKIYAQPFILMGVFVAFYNYLGFRLELTPFALTASAASMLYFAYLAGTLASSQAGALVQRLGYRRTTLFSQAAMMLGLMVTLTDSLPLIIVGLVVHTGGFFAAHAAVTAWAPAAAPGHTPEVSASYSLLYYAGSSVIGWAAGLLMPGHGWPWLVAVLSALLGVAALLVIFSPEPRRLKDTG